MHTCRLSLTLFVASFLVTLCSSAAHGQYLVRTPGGPLQYLGHGFGPGHHAPMIRQWGVRPPRIPLITYLPKQTELASASSHAHQGSAFGCSHGGCAPHTAPVYHEPISQHDPSPAANHQHSIVGYGPSLNNPQPVHSIPPAAFSLPTETRNPPSPTIQPAKKKPAAKKTTLKKQLFKKPALPKPLAKTPPVKKTRKQQQPPQPSLKTQRPKPARQLEENLLPDPLMPTADPLASPIDPQASYGW